MRLLVWNAQGANLYKGGVLTQKWEALWANGMVPLVGDRQSDVDRSRTPDARAAAGAMRYILVAMSTRNIAILALVIVVVVVIVLFVL